MSTLWLLLVPVCVAVYSLLLPIAPNDFWYHVRAGAEICATGRIPTTALFSSSVTPGTPYFYQSWISEVVLFQILKHGGLAAIQVLRTVCLTLAFTILLAATWRRCARAADGALTDTTRARIVALSTFLAFAGSASNMDVRPQTFSVPLFCVFAACLFEWPFLNARRRAAATAVLAALMLLWANTHGAFFTGMVLLGVFAVGEASHALLTRSEKFRRCFGGKLPVNSQRATLVLLACCALATVVNPRGPGIYSYVWLLARLQAGQKFIQEWQAPTFEQWYGTLFFITLFLIAFLVGVLLRRILSRTPGEIVQCGDEMTGSLGARFSEFLILAALAVMGLRDIRSIIWFALFCAPTVAALGTRLLTERVSKSKKLLGNPIEVVPRAAQIVNAIIALFLIFSFVPLLPSFKASWAWPPEYSAHFTRNPYGAFPIGFETDPSLLLENGTPVKAVEFLKADPPRGKIWNDFAHGSYLVWATIYEPRLAPHADPRVEMHSLEFWEEYGRIAAGTPDAPRVLAARNFSDVLLDLKEEPRLRKVLKAAGWREVFAAGQTVVLRRTR